MYIFNQYGITKIAKEHFNFILAKGFELEYDEDVKGSIIEGHHQIENRDYTVLDKYLTTKSRSGYQKIFSDEIKRNYGNTCAITGVTTRSLLKGAHIIPWAKDETRRLDPCNGLCLSPLVDECFEKEPAFFWLTENAGKFQFYMSYPEKNGFGIIYEPWHWCYRD